MSGRKTVVHGTAMVAVTKTEADVSAASAIVEPSVKELDRADVPGGLPAGSSKQEIGN